MKLLDKLLFGYSTLFALILTAAGFLNGLNISNLILVVLFLPVSLYLAFQLIKKIYALKFAVENLSEAAAEVKYGRSFSLKRFLTQSGAMYLITVTLYTAALTATVFLAITRALPEGL